MSYDNSANAVRRLEERFERLLLALADMQAAIGRLQQPRASSGGGSQQTSGGAVIFQVTAANNTISIAGTTGSTLAAPASLTISAISGGVENTVGTGSVYNPYAVATATGKALTLGLNTDGSYTVLSQSC